MITIYELFEYFQQREEERKEKFENLRMLNPYAEVLRVHWLVYCPQKVNYDFDGRYEALRESQKFNPRLLIGNLVHLAIQNLAKIAYEEISVENMYQKTIVDQERGNKYIIAGFPDILSEDEVYEIKYANGDSNLPFEHHVLQTQLYMWLTGRRLGRLIYITPKRVTEITVNQELTDNDVLELIDQLKWRDPIPRYDWECQYCPYNVICPKKR